LLYWPARVSRLIAAEMDVDPHLLQTILQSHINDLLTVTADRFDPAGLGEGQSPESGAWAPTQCCANSRSVRPRAPGGT
jgi:hypothetical protein